MDFRKPVRADLIREKPTTYLWNGRIPKGQISVVAGWPENGKSLFGIHVAAAVSLTGAKVLISPWENANKMKSRLKAADAKLENITVQQLIFPRDIDKLTEVVLEREIDFILLDPIAAHLGSGVSRYSENLREKFTNPISHLLSMTDAALLVIDHLIKNVPKDATSALQAIAGSASGIAAASQGEVYVMRKSPYEEGQFIVAPCKSNNEADDGKSIIFDLEVVEVEVRDDIYQNRPKLVLDSEISLDALSLISSQDSPRGPGRPPNELAEATEWLTEYLVGTGVGYEKAKKVYEDADAFGVTKRTLQRAAHKMQIVKLPKGGGQDTVWHLPDELKHIYKLATESDVDSAIDDILGDGDASS